MCLAATAETEKEKLEIELLAMKSVFEKAEDERRDTMVLNETKLRNVMSEVEKLRDEVDSLEKVVKERELKLRKMEESLGMGEKSLLDKDDRLESLERKMEETEQELQVKMDEFERKSEEMFVLEKQREKDADNIQEKEKKINEIEGALAESDATIIRVKEEHEKAFSEAREEKEKIIAEKSVLDIKARALEVRFENELNVKVELKEALDEMRKNHENLIAASAVQKEEFAHLREEKKEIQVVYEQYRESMSAGEADWKQKLENMIEESATERDAQREKASKEVKILLVEVENLVKHLESDVTRITGESDSQKKEMEVEIETLKKALQGAECESRRLAAEMDMSLEAEEEQRKLHDTMMVDYKELMSIHGALKEEIAQIAELKAANESQKDSIEKRAKESHQLAEKLENSLKGEMVLEEKMLSMEFDLQKYKIEARGGAIKVSEEMEMLRLEIEAVREMLKDPSEVENKHGEEEELGAQHKEEKATAKEEEEDKVEEKEKLDETEKGSSCAGSVDSVHPSVVLDDKTDDGDNASDGVDKEVTTPENSTDKQENVENRNVTPEDPPRDASKSGDLVSWSQDEDSVSPDLQTEANEEATVAFNNILREVEQELLADDSDSDDDDDVVEKGITEVWEVAFVKVSEMRQGFEELLVETFSLKSELTRVKEAYRVAMEAEELLNGEVDALKGIEVEIRERIEETTGDCERGDIEIEALKRELSESKHTSEEILKEEQLRQIQEIEMKEKNMKSQREEEVQSVQTAEREIASALRKELEEARNMATEKDVLAEALRSKALVAEEELSSMKLVKISMLDEARENAEEITKQKEKVFDLEKKLQGDASTVMDLKRRLSVTEVEMSSAHLTRKEVITKLDNAEMVIREKEKEISRWQETLKEVKDTVMKLESDNISVGAELDDRNEALEEALFIIAEKAKESEDDSNMMKFHERERQYVQDQLIKIKEDLKPCKDTLEDSLEVQAAMRLMEKTLSQVKHTKTWRMPAAYGTSASNVSEAMAVMNKCLGKCNQ